jgi:hypothetical protein
VISPKILSFLFFYLVHHSPSTLHSLDTRPSPSPNAMARSGFQMMLIGIVTGLVSGQLLTMVLRRVTRYLEGATTKPVTGGRVHGSSVVNRPLICDDLGELVGKTPLLRIHSLSEATGCDILVGLRVYQ